MTPRREFLQAASVMALFPKPGSRLTIAFAAGIPGADDASRAGFDVVTSLDSPLTRAVAIPFDAPLALEACRAGKDLWLPSPGPDDIETGRGIAAAVRRFGRIAQTAAEWRSAPSVLEARARVSSGAIGPIRFCRVFGGPNLLDIAQFVLDDPAPLSVTALSGNTHTYRYATLVLSHEHPAEFPLISFHGTRATLTISAPASDPMPHWRNFLESIRTRKQPAGHLACAIRTVALQRAAAQSLDRRLAVDWTEP